MTEGDVLSVMREAYLLILKLAGPLLIVSIVIGLVVAIFQAATQIHEQTLTFVPKIIVIVIMLLGLNPLDDCPAEGFYRFAVRYDGAVMRA